jgi:hypothetical protein
MGVENETAKDKPTVKSRIFSAATLCGVLTLLGYAGNGIYRIATDEFVAPCVLSPDSDLVIQSKLSMAQLVAERFHATTRREELDVTVEAADKAIAELEELKESAARGLDFTAALSEKQATSHTTDLRALARQHDDLVAMVAQQEAFTTQVKKDLEAGLAAKADYSRASQTLSQMKIAIIDNDRARITTESSMDEVNLTQQALRSRHKPGHIATPEMLQQQDQVVRITTEIIKLRSERRSAIAEKAHLDEELKMIDQLMGQLKERPTFSAADGSLIVAFVPYTQIEGVERGAQVYDCVWGLFACKSVGRVTKLLPGEVILPDPWGTLTRGQYATMDIDDASATKSRTLRVRPQHGGQAPAPPTGPRVAAAK